METVYVSKSGTIVIPVRIRRKYGMQPGTRIGFVEGREGIVVQPMTKDFVRETCGMLHSTTRVTRELVRERARDRRRENARVNPRCA